MLAWAEAQLSRPSAGTVSGPRQGSVSTHLWTSPLLSSSQLPPREHPTPADDNSNMHHQQRPNPAISHNSITQLHRSRGGLPFAKQCHHMSHHVQHPAHASPGLASVPQDILPNTVYHPYQQPHWATTLVLPLVSGKKAGYYPRVVELHFHLLLWCFFWHNYPSSRVVAATTLVAHQQLP
jgi:hypothetical protein